MIDFELKSIKFFEAGSQETPCFTAEIYENGKRVAYVNNDGHGGSSNVHPASGLKYADISKYDDSDVECEIFERVYMDGVIRKNQNKGLLFEEQGDVKIISFNKSISQLKKTPKGMEALRREIKLLREEGLEVINRNLKGVEDHKHPIPSYSELSRR